jgi:hypothetical protein
MQQHDLDNRHRDKWPERGIADAIMDYIECTLAGPVIAGSAFMALGAVSGSMRGRGCACGAPGPAAGEAGCLGPRRPLYQPGRHC